MDIKNELLARLADVAKRRDAEDQRHDVAKLGFDHEESVIKAMLALEEGRRPNGHADLMRRPLRIGAANATESAILDALSNRQEWDHGNIKGYLIERGLGTDDDPQFGRSVQGILLSMRGRELVESLGAARWRGTKKGLGAE